VSRLVNDLAMAKLTCAKIGHIAAAPLGPSRTTGALSTARAQLLIIVYWGSTQGSEGDDASQAVDRAVDAIAEYDGRESDGQICQRVKGGSVELVPLNVLEAIPAKGSK